MVQSAVKIHTVFDDIRELEADLNEWGEDLDYSDPEAFEYRRIRVDLRNQLGGIRKQTAQRGMVKDNPPMTAHVDALEHIDGVLAYRTRRGNRTSGAIRAAMHRQVLKICEDIDERITRTKILGPGASVSVTALKR